MNTKQLVERLKSEVIENKAFNDVFTMFSKRERTRDKVNLYSLIRRMELEGYKHDTNDYADILKKMADLGLGELELNKKGQIKSLKNIKITLQSLGNAAIGKGTQQLETFSQKNSYQKLTVDASVVSKAATGAMAGYPVSITVVINGKPVNFRVPKELNENEIADLVVRFRDKEASI